MKSGIINYNHSQLAVDPVAGEEGQIYYNTTTHNFMYHDGTTWVKLGSGPGNAVQVQYHQRQDQVACPIPIPANNNPRNLTEGTPILMQTITPTSNANILKIDVVTNFGSGALNVAIMLLNGPIVLATSRASYFMGGGPEAPATLTYYMTSPGTSPLLFTVHAGADIGGGTPILNTGTSGPVDNGALVSSLTITELSTSSTNWVDNTDIIELGSISGTHALLGDKLYHATLIGTTTLTLPTVASGKLINVLFEFSMSTAQTLNVPVSVQWANGVTPTYVSGASTVNSIIFETIDGGTSWRGYFASFS